MSENVMLGVLFVLSACLFRFTKANRLLTSAGRAKVPGLRPSRIGPSIWETGKKNGFKWIDQTPAIYGIKSFDTSVHKFNTSSKEQ